jgi:hypothetical protein
VERRKEKGERRQWNCSKVGSGGSGRVLLQLLQHNELKVESENLKVKYKEKEEQSGGSGGGVCCR